MRQEEKVIAIMVREHQPGYNPTEKKWFIPPDFMQNDLGDLFVGYEASARLSGLTKKYPQMFETTKLDKYVARKIKWLEMDIWFPLLPKNLQEVVRNYSR